MKPYKAHSITRMYPLVICALTLPLTGCGGGGAPGGAVAIPAPVTAPGPVVIPVPQNPLPAPTPEVTPGPVPTQGETPVPSPDPVTESPVEDGTSSGAEAAINRVRVDWGLPALRHDHKLEQVAEAYARRMATEGFYSHSDPEGKSVLDRVTAAGYEWAVVGENLARVRTKPGNEIEFAVNGWMNSPVHRANILRADYSESAVGMAEAADGATYLVQVLASPN